MSLPFSSRPRRRRWLAPDVRVATRRWRSAWSRACRSSWRWARPTAGLDVRSLEAWTGPGLLVGAFVDGMPGVVEGHERCRAGCVPRRGRRRGPRSDGDPDEGGGTRASDVGLPGADVAPVGAVGFGGGAVRSGSSWCRARSRPATCAPGCPLSRWPSPWSPRRSASSCSRSGSTRAPPSPSRCCCRAWQGWLDHLRAGPVRRRRPPRRGGPDTPPTTSHAPGWTRLP